LLSVYIYVYINISQRDNAPKKIYRPEEQRGDSKQTDKDGNDTLIDNYSDDDGYNNHGYDNVGVARPNGVQSSAQVEGFPNQQYESSSSSSSRLSRDGDKVRYSNGIGEKEEGDSQNMADQNKDIHHRHSNKYNHSKNDNNKHGDLNANPNARPVLRQSKKQQEIDLSSHKQKGIHALYHVLLTIIDSSYCHRHSHSSIVSPPLHSFFKKHVYLYSLGCMVFSCIPLYNYTIRMYKLDTQTGIGEAKRSKPSNGKGSCGKCAKLKKP
jgi:hypothetical protein